MTQHTHNQQPPRRTSESSTDPEPAAQGERSAQASPSVSHQAEQAARSVMHPDHHDPDWRYYFGAVVS